MAAWLNLAEPVEWFRPEQLTVRVDSEPVRLPQELREAVDRFWEAEVALHPQFFRGPLLTVRRVILSNRVEVVAGFTDFAHYLFSRAHRHDPRLDGFRVRPLFAAAIPVTADGYLIAALMGRETARPGRIQAIGGSAVPHEVRAGAFLAEASAGREMEEEVGFEPDRDGVRLRGVAGATLDEDGSMAIAVRFDLGFDLDESRARIAAHLARIASAGQVPELAGVVGLPWGQAGLAALDRRPEASVRYLRRMLIADALRRRPARTEGDDAARDTTHTAPDDSVH